MSRPRADVPYRARPAAPWHDKLLHLPAFLREPEQEEEPSAADLAEAFAMTGFFLSRHVLEPRGLAMLDARGSFVSAVVNARQGARAVW